MTVLLVIAITAFTTCKSPTGLPYQSEELEIQQLSPHTYRHISFLTTEQYGKVACNGLIVLQDGEALVLDAPTNNTASEELISWIEQQGAEVTGVVANHFHIDCLGGLDAFHNQAIPSYAHTETIRLAQADGGTLPQQGFDKQLELPVGKGRVINAHLGPGHTPDNLVHYYPTDRVLFGGCMIKSVGAGKGNLADANVAEWSNTVAEVKQVFAKAKIIVPGHGKAGGPELLDFTMALFRE